MLARADIAELWALRDDRFTVMCVKHDYVPKTDQKFLGQTQTKYEKKNWSSVMLFNNAKCRALTPDYVNTATGLQLHQFKWLDGEEHIGELPVVWNHLVNEYEYRTDAKIVHFTDGGPYFSEYRNDDYAASGSPCATACFMLRSAARRIGTLMPLIYRYTPWRDPRKAAREHERGAFHRGRLAPALCLLFCHRPCGQQR